jgi:hypothetical protein
VVLIAPLKDGGVEEEEEGVGEEEVDGESSSTDDTVITNGICERASKPVKSESKNSFNL